MATVRAVRVRRKAILTITKRTCFIFHIIMKYNQPPEFDTLLSGLPF